MNQKKQEELKKFLKAIFGGTAGCIDIRTFVHTKKKDKIETKQRDHFFIKIKELKDLVRILSNDNFTKDRNVHFGVAPRAIAMGGAKQTGSENDVKILNCIFGDVDCKRESDPSLPTKKETIKRIEKFELPPSIIVDSGLGYQVYWLLKVPIPIKNRKILLETKGILKGLAQKLGGDVAAQDVSHCLRVPGTLNLKPECPKEGLEVKIVKFEPNLKYGPEFKKFMVKIEDTSGIDVDIKDVPIPPRFEKLLKKNKKLQNTYLKRNRPDLSDPSGSGYDMALANILIKNKFTDSEIAAIIKNSKTGTKKKITPSYLAITIRKGRAFEKERKEKNELKIITAEDFRPTDLWNSENFFKKYLGQSLYCKKWNSWLIYREGKWQEDDRNETQELAKKVIMGYYREASEILDDKERKRLVSQALKSESQRAIRAMTDLATSTLPAVPDDFDQDIYILNLKNGTMDLNTLEFREHRPEDMLTKIARVNYEPGADCPKWLAFLDKVFEGKEDITEYIRTSLGYSLTGDIGEQCLYIFYGIAFNGKSTFINVIQEILGDYAINTPFETFLTRRGEHIPNDIARMKGARFVNAIEAGEGRGFNEELLKRLTGRDKVTARFLRQEFFEFHPTCKLWLAANHKPTVKEFSPAYWGRIRLIPFKLTIPEEERIPHYENILLKEKEGIFNWMLEGCKRWKEEGLKVPEEIKEATEQYKDQMDIMAEFIEECCIENRLAQATTKKLYIAYKDWCEESKEKEINKRAFGRRLEERGYKTLRIGQNRDRGWGGIDLKGEEQKLPYKDD
ncbi:hypothetical protein ES705_25080 [subsurface metagenome]